MIRLDMKEFFMSGDSTQLSEALQRLFLGTSVCNLVVDVCFWLLATQRITCRDLPGRFWEVSEGSGMGLTNSSSVVDAAF